MQTASLESTKFVMQRSFEKAFWSTCNVSVRGLNSTSLKSMKMCRRIWTGMGVSSLLPGHKFGTSFGATGVPHRPL